jgi:hypothetical protein
MAYALTVPSGPAIFVLVFAAAQLSGCSTQPPAADQAPRPVPPPSPPLPTEAPGPAGSVAPAPPTPTATGTAGASKPEATCGQVELACIGKRAPKTRPAEVSCLIDAYARCEPKRLEVTRYTIEGDPIVTTYAVGPRGAKGCDLIASVDSSKDRFGSKGVRTEVCSGLQATADCPWISPTGCAAKGP